jgi:hypothetical protein
MNTARSSSIRLLHYLKSSGARVAQASLLRSTKIPTHGVSSGATIYPLHASGAVAAQLPPRARSAPSPLCATGPRSRLTAPLGQRRTLTTGKPEQDDRSPTRPTCGKPWGRGRHRMICKGCWKDLITRSCVCASNNPRLPIAARPPHSLAARVTRAFAAAGHTITAASANTHQRTRQAACPSPPCARHRRAVPNTVGHGARSHVFASFHAVLWRPMPIWEDHGKAVEGIYARALSRPLTVLEGKTRARYQASNRRRNVDCRRNAGIGPDHPSGSRGGGGEFRARRILDVVSSFRGPLSQNSGAPVLKKLGRPVKPAALTQGSHRIRQTDLAASRAASEPEPAPAAISESRGISP